MSEPHRYRRAPMTRPLDGFSVLLVARRAHTFIYIHDALNALGLSRVAKVCTLLLLLLVLVLTALVPGPLFLCVFCLWLSLSVAVHDDDVEPLTRCVWCSSSLWRCRCRIVLGVCPLGGTSGVYSRIFRGGWKAAHPVPSCALG